MNMNKFDRSRVTRCVDLALWRVFYGAHGGDGGDSHAIEPAENVNNRATTFETVPKDPEQIPKNPEQIPKKPEQVPKKPERI